MPLWMYEKGPRKTGDLAGQGNASKQRRWAELAALLVAWLLAAATAAQSVSESSKLTAEGLRVHAMTLVHRKAGDALQLVEPLLSPRGTVELQVANNTLVVRDTLAALTRIVSAVRAFDRPARPVVLELELLRGERSPALEEGNLPAPRLAAQIRRLLPYPRLVALARARLSGLEGEAVAYELHHGYRVSFAFGNWTPDQKMRLERFRVVRMGPSEERQLLGTSVHVRVSQPLVLALTRDEASERALLLVLELDQPEVSGG